MGAFTSISAAVRTRTGRKSGTSASARLMIIQRGRALLDREMKSAETVGSLRRKECLYYFEALPPETAENLTDELIGPDDLQVRLGFDQIGSWEPELALVLARSREKGTIPLALDMGLTGTLSGEERLGVASIDVRRVAVGAGDTLIRRLLLVVVTYDAPYAGTDDPIWVRVRTAAGVVAHHVVTDTPQTDLEIDTANIYELPVEVPFTKGDLADSDNGEIRLGIHGSDKWVPKRVLLFGLDEASGAPRSVVSLVRLSDPGPLSADPTEGVPSIVLALDQ
ncbi:MAG: hypothetical protein GTO46_11900 [Gemmatimonadetes bacterium]|nr:hypothetical protein [Gemmatimonadota bacterium]NIO32293.1 hypothetical protein [Gemmatimonadota bacterium]